MEYYLLSAKCPLGVISVLSGCGGLAPQLLPPIWHGKGEGLTTHPGISANLMDMILIGHE